MGNLAYNPSLTLSQPETETSGAFKGYQPPPPPPLRTSSRGPWMPTPAEMQEFFNRVGGTTELMYNQEITRGGKSVREYRVTDLTLEPPFEWTAHAGRGKASRHLRGGMGGA